ncbi:DUF7601 domain-containing protein [Lacrimispora sp.]|uniref:DUF7601 domain-containing protein n=1 Tax=Lacrimispora sp. TaxID=2719234 RepID=UPI0028ADBA58|nr:hypothetical protein [Lacrimispora sp.]
MIQKQKKRFPRMLLTTALAAVMCLEVTASAFADNGPLTGSETTPAKASITKMLNMPEGTTTPEASFTFSFTKKSYMGETADTALNQMPAISPVTVTFLDTDTGSTDSQTGIKSVPKEVEVIPTFTSTGIYTYDITENADTYTIDDPEKETMAYSHAKYEISYYVKEKSGHSGFFVETIVTKVLINDDGTAGSGEKINPNPGGPTGSGSYSGLVFNNAYTKNNGGVDPTIPANQVLAISKVVAGDFADETKYFSYDVSITKPAVLTAEVVYKAYIVDSTGVVTGDANVTSGDTGSIKTDSNGKKYIEITTGTTKVINLKHNQILVFNDLEVGAKYVADLQGTVGYTPKARITANGSVITPDLTAAEGQNLSTGSWLIGENKNSADFTNTFQTITPTGIVINNLPFIMILIIAAGAFAAFVAAKSHKKHVYSSRH